ncbi:MAG: response regulator [Terriglobia bacterium]
MSLKIMVVDDQIDTLASIKGMLESLGSDVLTFADSREAAAELKSQRFDAVFIEAQLPHLNGCSLTRLVRSSTQNSEAPVIVLADQDDIQTARLALEAGASHIISKPVTLESLAIALHAVADPALARTRADSPATSLAPVNCSAGPNGERQFVAQGLNINESGMLLECPAGLEVGQAMSLQFSPPSVDKPLQLPAKVVFRTPPDRLGVQFIELPAAAREATQTLIDSSHAPVPLTSPPAGGAAAYLGLMNDAVVEERRAKEAESNAQSLAAPIDHRKFLVRPAAYLAGILVISFLTYRMVSTTNASLETAPVEKLACVVQPKPPSPPSGLWGAVDSNFVTLSPAVVQVESHPGQRMSYTLTLTNYSNQELSFQLTAADIVKDEGKLIHIPGSESPAGVAASVKFSRPAISAQPRRSASVNVTLTEPRDPATRSVLIVLNGTDEIRAWQDRIVQASPGSMATFVNSATSDQAAAEGAPAQVFMTNYTVCQWRLN